MLIATALRSFAYTTIIVKDSISTNTHWTCDNQYQLQGYVYVTSGATLTIDPGVIIRGDKDSKGALIIERGAKIKALGTATSPIVFTSNQPVGTRTYGDWGGVILCGYSPVNWTAGQAQVEGGPRSFYGGTDPHDNSGEMHYTRIEFAGIAFSPNNEVNGLTFCGVGDATQIDHIQVSYSGDDSYEWFGGTVNVKYLVAFRGWDDDFDQDCGWQGKGQFAAGIRDNVADVSGSKGMECDSYQSGTATGLTFDATKLTKPVWSNVTLVGATINPGSTTIDPNFVAGVHLRRGNATSLLNSIVAGWPCGLLIDESSSSFGSTVANIGNGELQFRNNIICGISNLAGFNKDAMFVKDGARSLTPTTANGDTTSSGTDWSVLAGGTNLGPESFLRNPAYGNKTYATEQSSVLLGNPFNLTNPNLVPNSTSPICYSSTHFVSWGAGVNDVFNPALPLSYDTTSPATYNVPGVPPNFTTSKASDAFFTPVNYVGAFPGTGHTSDNWMLGWCNFDPNNTSYDTICYVAPPIDSSAGVAHVNNNFSGDKVYPNPAKSMATLQLELPQTCIAKVTIMDMTGKKVKDIFNGKVPRGIQSFNFDTNDLANGLYMIVINAANKQEVLKFTVTK
jgi:hypothetical protein